MSSGLGRAHNGGYELRYIGKADITRFSDFEAVMYSLGYEVRRVGSKYYFRGPKCEVEQRFFMLGCLRMWKAAEAAGHVAPVPDCASRRLASQDDPGTIIPDTPTA